MPSIIIKHAQDILDIIIQSPVPFSVIFILGCLIAYLAARIRYQGTIDTLKQRVSLLQERLDTNEQKNRQSGYGSDDVHKNETPIKQSTGLGLSNWVSGNDLMKKYELSAPHIVQHILGGLSVYPADTDIYFTGNQASPMTESEFIFEISVEGNENLEHVVENFWFKKVDVDDYVARTTQQGASPERKNSGAKP